MRLSTCSAAVLSTLILAACNSDSDDAPQAADTSEATVLEAQNDAAQQSVDQQSDPSVQAQARVLEGEEVKGLALESFVSDSDFLKLKLPELFGEPVINDLGKTTIAPDRMVDAFVINSAQQYASFRERLEGGPDSLPPQPEVDFGSHIVLAYTEVCTDHVAPPAIFRISTSQSGSKILRLADPSQEVIRSISLDDVIPAEELVEDICAGPKGHSVSFYKLPRSVDAPFSFETRSWSEADSLNLDFDLSPFQFSVADAYNASENAVVFNRQQFKERLVVIPNDIGTFFLRDAELEGLISRAPSESGQSQFILFKDSFTLQQFWQRLQREVPEVQDPPVIDFSQERLLAVSGKGALERVKYMILEDENVVFVDLLSLGKRFPVFDSSSALGMTFVRVSAKSEKVQYLAFKSDRQGRWR